MTSSTHIRLEERGGEVLVIHPDGKCHPSNRTERALWQQILDIESVAADHKRLVRELDVALNGEAGAAKQASLCDLVAQVRKQPAVPEWLLEMSQQMRTQENRMTSHPFWQVRCKRYLPTEQGCGEVAREVVGEDGVIYRTDQPIDILLQCLISEHEDWCKSWAEDNHPDEPWQSALENWFDLDDDDDLPDGLRKVHVQEVEEVVSTHLTQADAEWFIKRKQHDYPPLYTYVESAYWSPQLRKLQDWIIGLTTQEAPHDQ